MHKYYWFLIFSIVKICFNRFITTLSFVHFRRLKPKTLDNTENVKKNPDHRGFPGPDDEN